MKKFILILIIFTLLIPLSNALLDVNATEIGDTFIKWEWTASGIQNISVDGFSVCNFDNSSMLFILTGLSSEETHSIKINSNSDSGINTTTTTKSSQNSLLDTLLYYKFLIVAWFLLLISIALDSPIVGIFGTAIMGISFIFYITISTFSIDSLIYGISLMFSVIIGLAQWR